METSVNSAPAAFKKDNIEIFVLNGEEVFCENGQMRPFNELPSDKATQLRQELENDPRAIRGLSMLGITNPIEQLRHYAFCRFGDFDKVADTDEDGETVTEYWNCGRRPCAADGFLCKLPEVPNGRLTPHDGKIIRVISADLPNKQIADRMGTSLHTVNTQCKNIARKIGVQTKTGIAAFAGRNNIL